LNISGKQNVALKLLLHQFNGPETCFRDCKWALCPEIANWVIWGIVEQADDVLLLNQFGHV